MNDKKQSHAYLKVEKKILVIFIVFKKNKNVVYTKPYNVSVNCENKTNNNDFQHDLGP